MAKNPEHNFAPSDNEPWEYGTFVGVDSIADMIKRLKEGVPFMLVDADLAPPLKMVLGWVEAGANDEFQVRVEIYVAENDCSSLMTNDLLSELEQIFPYEIREDIFPVFKVGKSQLVLERLQKGYRVSTGKSDLFGRNLDLLPAPTATERRSVEQLMKDVAILVREVVEQLYLNSGMLAPDQDIILSSNDMTTWDFGGEPEVSEFDTKELFLPLTTTAAETVTLAPEKKITFDDIGGNDALKEELMSLAAGLRDPSIYSHWGINPPAGILLAGPTGTGKTLAVRALASEAGVTLKVVTADKLKDMWYGNSEKLTAALFDEAEKRPGRTIIFIDEIDTLFQSRDRGDVHDATASIEGVLFQRLDGIGGNGKVTIIAATNHMSHLDRALIRPGRFDIVVQVPLPDGPARKKIFQIHIEAIEQAAGRKIFRGLKWPEIIQKTEGYSGAAISAVLKSVGNGRVKDGIFGRKVRETVTNRDLVEAIEDFRPEEFEKSKRPMGFAGLHENR